MLLVGVASLQWKRRHGKLGTNVHGKLIKKCKFEVKVKWYKHEPESVKCYKDLCDFSIQNHNVTEAHKLDFVAAADFAVLKKIEHLDLARELHKIWQLRIQFIHQLKVHSVL